MVFPLAAEKWRHVLPDLSVKFTNLYVILGKCLFGSENLQMSIRSSYDSCFYVLTSFFLEKKWVGVEEIMANFE